MERERKRELPFPFDERKISVCGLYVCAAPFRTEISRVNIFAAEKYERREEESFEKSVIDARNFVSFFFFSRINFIDERSFLNFNMNLDTKEEG